MPVAPVVPFLLPVWFSWAFMGACHSPLKLFQFGTNANDCRGWEVFGDQEPVLSSAGSAELLCACSKFSGVRLPLLSAWCYKQRRKAMP